MPEYTGPVIGPSDALKRYHARCRDCEEWTSSDSLTKALSDADWHNTMTGHDSEVLDMGTNEVVDRWLDG